MDILDQTTLGETEDDYRDHPLLRMVTCDPAFRGGKPYIRDAGLTVRGLLHMLANGWTMDQILDQYPRVTQDHVRAALLYAAWKTG